MSGMHGLNQIAGLVNVISLIFQIVPGTKPTRGTQVAAVISLLHFGRVLEWREVDWDRLTLALVRSDLYASSKSNCKFG